MASYTFKSLEDRRRVENLWEKGRAPKEIAGELGTSVTVIYNAELAQLRVQESLERRGKRKSSGG